MKALYIFIALLMATTSAHADRVRLLSDDKDALQARVDLIQQAKTEILAEYFSVWNDYQSAGGFALLLDAARRGVKVKVVLDALSVKVPKSFYSTLREQGKDANGNINIEIKLYNPFTLNLHKLTRRDHAKMLIVDGKRMITGGRNIGDKYFGFNNKRNFKDLDILLDGKAVQEARADFYAVFNSPIVKDSTKEKSLPSTIAREKCDQRADEDRRRCERRKKTALRAYTNTLQRLEITLDQIEKADPKSTFVKSNTGTDWLADVKQGADIKFLSHKPDELVTKKTAYLSHALMALVKTAEKELNIMSPYLIPTPEVMAIFQELIFKGVKIRVVTNSLQSTDNFFAQAAYISAKEAMTEMGIEIYEYNGPDTAHGKGFIMDGKIAFVGTFNLDPRSLYLNREVGVLIKSSPDNQLVESLALEIEQLRANSLLIAQDGHPQNVEEQQRRYKTLSKGKRALVRLIRLFVPVFKNQVY